LLSAAAGLALGSIIGVLAGIAMGLIKPVGKSLDLLVEILRPIPSIALLPIGLLILGLGYEMEISIVAFAVTWPMLVFARAAVGGIEPLLLETSHILEMSSAQALFKIVIPAMLPRLFVGLRVSAAVALIVSITVEIAANPIGLGHAIMMAQSSLRPADMYAFIAWLAGLGWLLNWGFIFAERKLFGDLSVTRPSA